MEPERRTGPITEGTLLWEPSEEYRDKAIITHFMGWLGETRNLSFTTYNELWQWSVTDLEAFWASIWDYFQIKAHKSVRRGADKPTYAGSTLVSWSNA